MTFSRTALHEARLRGGPAKKLCGCHGRLDMAGGRRARTECETGQGDSGGRKCSSPLRSVSPSLKPCLNKCRVEPQRNERISRSLRNCLSLERRRIARVGEWVQWRRRLTTRESDQRPASRPAGRAKQLAGRNEIQHIHGLNGTGQNRPWTTARMRYQPRSGRELHGR